MVPVLLQYRRWPGSRVSGNRCPPRCFLRRGRLVGWHRG